MDMDAETLLTRARTERTPLVDGETVTFVWQGFDPPQLMGDWTGWQLDPSVALAPVAPDVWTYTATWPRDAYLEYIYTRDGQNLRDEFNPRRVSNGFGGVNQFFYMPEVAPTPLVERTRGTPRGQFARVKIATEDLVTGAERMVFLYQPPVKEPVPLLVVLDGVDYVRRAR